MENHFEIGYKFILDGKERYIAFVDYDHGIPHYDTYPVVVKEQLDKNPDLLFDYDFVDEYRICMDEHELYELRIKELETPKKISIQTPIGQLEACISGSPSEYPEIYVYLTRPDGAEIDLLAAAVDLDTKVVKGYLYGNTRSDDWTKVHRWTPDEINVNFSEEDK